MDDKMKFFIQDLSLIAISSVLLIVFKQRDSFININNMVDSQGYQINSSASIPMATTQTPSADITAIAGTGYTPPASYTGTATLALSNNNSQVAPAQAVQAVQAAQVVQAAQAVQAAQVAQAAQAVQTTTQISAPPPDNSGTSTALIVLGSIALVGAIGGGAYLFMLNGKH